MSHPDKPYRSEEISPYGGKIDLKETKKNLTFQQKD